MSTTHKPDQARAVAWADPNDLANLPVQPHGAALPLVLCAVRVGRLTAPLYTQATLDAAVAEAVAAERERKRPGEARLRVEAERWRALCARLLRSNPMLGRWKVIEVSPTFGDETEIPDLEKAVDEYAAAIRRT